MRARLLGPLRSIRSYSQVSESQAKRWEYLSLIVKGKGYQALALDRLRQYVSSKQKQGKWAAEPAATSSSLVLLASRDVAPWLEDGQFMSEVLDILQVSSQADGKATIDVLSGVVDGLSPYRCFGAPRSGLSLMYGQQNMLPQLWSQGAAESGHSPDRAASISFYTARPADPFNSNVTMPLANTIFQNGRRSTLFATRYEKNPSGRAEAILRQEKTHQDVHFTSKDGPYYKPELPLIPLAPPRKIVTGLGNIVRQVEIDGKASPASKELEELIPRLLATREKQGAVGVWAVVIPPHVIDSVEIKAFSGYTGDSTKREVKLLKLNTDALRSFTKLGCRVHKILSGGGGWGAKQGLLSLDPDTSYTAPEQESIDDFIKAFESRNSDDPSQGIVTPGSYILFCTQPELPPNHNRYQYINRGIYFGVAEKADDQVLLPQRVFEKEEVESESWVAPYTFSAMSAEGMYLKLDTPGPEEAGIKSYPFTTKIDVPHSYLRHTGVAA